MAKKKTKKVSKNSSKKTIKKISRKTIARKNSNSQNSIQKTQLKRRPPLTKILIKLTIFIIIIFGFYKMWTYDMYQGLGLVVLGLILFLIAKLIENIKRK